MSGRWLTCFPVLELSHFQTSGILAFCSVLSWNALPVEFSSWCCSAGVNCSPPHNGEQCFNEVEMFKSWCDLVFFLKCSVLFSPCISVGTNPTEVGGVGLGAREKKKAFSAPPSHLGNYVVEKKTSVREKTHFQLISSWIQFVRHKSLCWHSRGQELRQGGGWALPLSVG